MGGGKHHPAGIRTSMRQGVWSARDPALHRAASLDHNRRGGHGLEERHYAGQALSTSCWELRSGWHDRRYAIREWRKIDCLDKEAISGSAHQTGGPMMRHLNCKQYREGRMISAEP